MTMPVFYGNAVGAQLKVIRKEDLPEGTRPQDVLGPGTYTLEAPDSERARSLLAARLSAAERATVPAVAVPV